MYGLIAASICDGQFQLVFTPGEAIRIKPIGDHGLGIHLKERILPIYLSPIMGNPT